MNGAKRLQHGRPGTPVPGVWRAILGFIVWATEFVVLYVGHAVGCLYVPPVHPSAVTAALLALWVLHAAVGAILAWRSGGQWRRLRHSQGAQVHARFMWRVTFLIDASALGAIVVTGLPVLAFPACSP